jgi:hypothetical protein
MEYPGRQKKSGILERDALFVRKRINRKKPFALWYTDGVRRIDD